MDHQKILKRSWDILWNYRALWLFGILVAILVAGGSSHFNNSNYTFNSSDSNIFPHDQNWSFSIKQFFEGLEDFQGAIFGAVIGLACISLIFNLIFVFLYYIANTALIRMVDDYEETGEKRTVGQGFKLGWSKASWRIFLINLIIDIPVALVSILLIILSLSPLLLWLTKNNAIGIIGTIAAIGLFFITLLVVIVLSAAARIFVRFFQREAALENLGVFESIRAGYALVRKNFKDTILMWLILLGIQIVYGIGMFILSFILLIMALVIGGIPALIAMGIGKLIGGNVLPIVLGILVGLPIFIIIMVLPTLFLRGLKEVYLSTAWTLTYREFTVLKGVSPILEPETDNEGIEDVKPDEPNEGTEPSIDDIP